VRTKVRGHDLRAHAREDAHRFEHAGFLRLGAGIARKGWLTKEDVVNTLPLNALVKELGKKRAKRR
jgi:DNA polymerase (family 10)